MKKILGFLGINQSMAAALLMAIFVGLGEKMAERFLPIYLIALGASTLIPGVLNSLTNFLGAIYSLPAGILTDKIGYKKSLLVFNLIAIFGYLLVIIIPHWIAVIIGSIFFLAWSALSLPAVMSLVSMVVPKNKRAMGVSMHSMVRRIPMALGPVLGGLLIDRFGTVTGVRFAFCGAIFFGIIAILVQQKYIEDKKSAEDVEKGAGFWSLIANMPVNLRHLLVSDILIRFCEQIPYAYIAIWAMTYAGGAKINGVEFGILTAIEMTVAMFIYVPVAWLADKGTKKPYVAITFVNFTLFPLFLLLSKSFTMLVLAFIVRGLKEFGEATRKALILDLAPETQKASSFGAYYLMRDTIVSVGALGGAFLWQISPEVNLWTAFAFGVAGSLYFIIYGKSVENTNADS